MTLISNLRWTTSDLELFPDNTNRYEIVDGELLVTRAPHLRHQAIADAICTELRNWSRNTGLGNAYTGIGILFSESDHVIADVVWVRQGRLDYLLDDSGHLTGAPDLIVEVLSSSAQDRRRDRELKFKLYSIQGVQDYWIVDREQQSVEIFRRHSAQLEKVSTLFVSDQITSPLLPDFECLVSVFFEL